MKLPGIHCILHGVELHKSIAYFPAVLLVSGLLFGINAAQAAMFSINFYEQTGNINENGHNFFR